MLFSEFPATSTGARYEQASYILCRSKMTAQALLKNRNHAWLRYTRRRLRQHLLKSHGPASKELFISLISATANADAAQYTIKG